MNIHRQAVGSRQLCGSENQQDTNCSADNINPFEGGGVGESPGRPSRRGPGGLCPLWNKGWLLGWV